MQVQQNHSIELPVPDAGSSAHSEMVADFLRSRIAAEGGCIGFAEFMQHALYAPGLGYYVSGSRKFGAKGDFVTAPEVSPLFGAVLGRQCAPILQQLKDSGILEIGAGSGALAVHLMKKLAEAGALPVRYCILEPSADLQSRQKLRIAEELGELAKHVEWIAGWPREFVGVIVANEVADALPVSRFAIRGGEVMELCVTCGKHGFAWHERSAPVALRDAVREIESAIGDSLPEGYLSEVCRALPPWIGDMAGCMKSGFVFLFDYGVSRREYYGAEKNRGWLRCHFRQRAHDDPLIYPGIQDLTSWVDFSAVAHAASESGMQVAGFVTQAHFLLNGGLQDELTEFAGLPVTAQLELSRQVKLLTLPAEMGENFKCIGFAKQFPYVPAVFASSDRAHIL